jgi:cell division septal protein FtsQ
LERPRAVSGAIVLAIAVLGVWIGFDDAFYAAAPVVTGRSRVPAEEIVRGSRLEGLHVLWVNSREVEATLLQTTPAIRAARASCALPADCTIAVAEREPLFAWRWGQATVWIDQAGVVFPARANGPDLVTVESVDAQPPPPGQQVDPSRMTAIVAAMQALPDVRAFRYSAARGLELADPGGYPVYLGTGSNMSDRAAVWRALRADLAGRGITPKYIDVRFPLAPYYER